MSRFMKALSAGLPEDGLINSTGNSVINSNEVVNGNEVVNVQAVIA